MTEESAHTDSNVETLAGEPCDRADCPQRVGGDRRQGDRRGVVDRRVGLDRRRGPGRRRSDDRRSAEEGEMTDEQFDFIMAIDEYKRVNRRPFPTWTEVLDVIHALGYRKVADPQDLQ
jgi:hypothetical protein